MNLRLRVTSVTKGEHKGKVQVDLLDADQKLQALFSLEPPQPRPLLGAYASTISGAVEKIRKNLQGQLDAAAAPLLRAVERDSTP